MNKIIGLLLLTFSMSVSAHHSITHNVEELIKKGMATERDFAYCRSKAKMGKEVHMHRETVTLEFQLDDLMKSHNNTPDHQKLPRYVVIEMQRVIRDAYRSYKTSDEYYTAVFEECAVSGF